MPTDTPEEPSNFALSISEKLIEGDSFDLTAEERSNLTPYERAVLERTAARNSMIGHYWMRTGTVTFRKNPDSY
jgi:hypothetical protein